MTATTPEVTLTYSQREIRDLAREFAMKKVSA